MRLLVISPTPTSPADQGNRQRVLRLCRALRERGAEIHFGYFPREWGGRFSPLEQREMTRDWDYFDTIVPSKPFVYQTDERYFGIDDWWDEAIGRFIRYKVDGERFDCCLVNYAFFSKAFEYLPRNVFKILDTHDRMSGRREMLEQQGIEPEFFYTTEAEEKVALDRADLVLAINEEEADFFRSISSTPVVTLGHVTEPETAETLPSPVDGQFRMGFLGSSNSVNVTNVNNFLAAVHRAFPNGMPGVQFCFYGSCCSRIQIPQGFATPQKFFGRVETVDEFYSNVDCVFVPFIFGTGQKIKLIEALSYEIPLLATASASEGSGSTAEMHNLAGFDEVISAMRRYVEESSYRELVAEASRAEFARYQARVSTTPSIRYSTWPTSTHWPYSLIRHGLQPHSRGNRAQSSLMPAYACHR